METLPRTPESLETSFDLEQRRYDDTTTWLAEVLDGSMRTSFEYTYRDGELISQDGDSMRDIFDKAIEDAEEIAWENPDQTFELRRRKLEQEEYGLMVEMAAGHAPNTMVIISDFPPELMNAEKDVGGYNVTRKQTMLRVITKIDSGIEVSTQSLDGSNRLALESIYDALHQPDPQPGELLGQRILVDLEDEEQETILSQLTGVYDASLHLQTGKEHQAGRLKPWSGNTYDFVREQDDLIQAYLVRLDPDCKENKYNLAAAMTRRFEGQISVSDQDRKLIQSFIMSQIIDGDVVAEMDKAGREAIAQGQTFSGCGLSIGGNDSAARNGIFSELFELGFGNKVDEDRYGSRKFKCPKGHTNKRPVNQLIEKCQICKCSVRC